MLLRPCPECRFTAAAVSAAAVAGLLRENAAAWVVMLTGEVTSRPAPEVWSPLEYACHLRDVHRVYGDRLALMLAADDPQYPSWDQNKTAVDQRYNLQEPARVSAELVAAAEMIAGHLDRVVDWSRTGLRGDGARFTSESLARYVAHEAVHHLHDVTVEPPGEQTDAP